MALARGLFVCCEQTQILFVVGFIPPFFLLTPPIARAYKNHNLKSFTALWVLLTYLYQPHSLLYLLALLKPWDILLQLVHLENSALSAINCSGTCSPPPFHIPNTRSAILYAPIDLSSNFISLLMNELLTCFTLPSSAYITWHNGEPVYISTAVAVEDGGCISRMASP